MFYLKKSLKMSFKVEPFDDARKEEALKHGSLEFSKLLIMMKRETSTIS